jgi:hypothetical protein
MDSASYQVMESLKPRDKMSKLFWNGEPEEIFKILCSLFYVNDKMIDELFGAEFNGIRYRA